MLLNFLIINCERHGRKWGGLFSNTTPASLNKWLPDEDTILGLKTYKAGVLDPTHHSTQ
jgi:hypothetical protein